MQSEQLIEKTKRHALGAGLRKTKTLYVREEDQAVWDEAREIVGDSLSTYLTNHLKTLVASRKAAQQGFERIIVRFTKDKMPCAQAFYGRWIISPASPFFAPSDSGYDIEPTDCYTVAITPKNNVVVFQFWAECLEVDQEPPAGEHYFPQGALLVFPSLDDLGNNPDMPSGLVAAVMKRQGIEIQELDI